jgi:hypothetical protein
MFWADFISLYAYRPIYWLGASLGVVATILAYFTEDISPKMNNQLSVDMHQAEKSLLDNVIHHKHHEKHEDLGHHKESQMAAAHV